MEPIMTALSVELFVVPDCPHEPAAAQLLRTALDDVGLTRTPFQTTVIATQQQAEQCGFLGSPTIRINGDDPFRQRALPHGGQGRAQSALACRVYPTPTGPAGLPPLADLRKALKRAADQ